MKAIFLIILLIMLVQGVISQLQSQTIIIGNGAEINVGTGSDICAKEFGNISGGLTGSGTQCGGVLPVLISSFTASVENGRDIKITWTTTMELNNKGFEIERKSANENWINTGWINGNGNSNIPITYIFSDKKLNVGKYSYRLKQIDYNGNFEYHTLNSDVIVSKPNEFSISQNYPNPSNPVSNINFQLPSAGKVTIKVYDIAGREVVILVDEYKEAGYYNTVFDGNNLSSGVYFYRIFAEVNGQKINAVKKLLLLK